MRQMYRVILLSFLPLFLLPSLVFGQSQVNNVNVLSLMPQSTIFFSPREGTFIDGGNFDVSVYIDTKKGSINAIDLLLKFDPAKLQVTHSLGGRSIIGIWLEPPVYSNNSGTIHLVGTIPNGIITESGLITTVTFKAISSGDAKISVSEASQVLANDGLGSNVVLTTDVAHYSIMPTPPGGVRVFSDTHPFNDQWYNNNSAALGWYQEEGVTAFSYTFDDRPFTTPDNSTQITTDTIKGYENLPDGIWYFHIKAKKQGVWGSTTHFLVRIDTTPPAKFTPTIDVLSAAVIRSRGLISFFTTDTLSGVDHYEVGVILPGGAPDASSAYVEAQSPYQLPGYLSQGTRVIVRAFDRAGNIQSASILAGPTQSVLLLLKNNTFIFIIAFFLAVIICCAVIIFFPNRLRELVERMALLTGYSNATPARQQRKHLIDTMLGRKKKRG